MSDTNLTKREFARVIKELMTRAAFDKINVGSLCKASGLSRKTFYYHFRDKYELVNWVFFTEFVQVMQDDDGTDEWSLILALCEYLHQNRRFYVHAFAIEGQDAFSDYFASFFTPPLYEMMNETFSKSLYQEIYVSFFVDAMIMAIARWLREDRLPPGEFVAFLRECIYNVSKEVTVRAERAASEGE